MTDLLGFGTNTANVAITRPDDSRLFGVADTFAKDCSSPNAGDGTAIPSAWANGLMGQLRAVVRGNGNLANNSASIVAIDNADDTMALKAIMHLIQRGQQVSALDTGSANSIVVALTPAMAEYKFGMALRIKCANANTGATTINVNGVGQVALQRDGNALKRMDIGVGQMIDVIYDGDAFQLLSPIYRVFIEQALTFTVGPVGDFANLSDAMAWLSRRRIATTGSVKFNLLAGQVIYSANLLLDHPDSARVAIEGAALTGAFPVYADFTVSGYSSGARASDRAANLTMLRSRFASEMRFTNGAGLDVRGDFALSSVLITSDGSGAAQGLVCRSGLADVKSVSVHGFASRGFVCAAGYVNLLYGTSSGNGDNGFTADDGGSVGYIGDLVSVGNGVAGFYAGNASSIRTTQGVALRAAGNGSNGLSAEWSGVIWCGANSRSDLNGGHGFQAKSNGSMRANGATANNNAASGFVGIEDGYLSALNVIGGGNAAWGVLVSEGSTCISTGAGVTGVLGASSPGVNVVGNGNSINIQ